MEGINVELEALITCFHEELVEATTEDERPMFKAERIGNTLHVEHKDSGKWFEIVFRAKA